MTALEFQPQTKANKPRALTAVGVREPKGGDSTMRVLAVVAVICIGGGIAMTMMASPPEPVTPVADNVAAPPPPAPESFKSYDNRISITRFSDNPQELARQLEFFGSIMFNSNPEFSTAQIGPKLRRVGETCGPDDEYTIVRIDRYVVFLRDKKDKLHRLIDPARWDYVRKQYQWPDLPDLPEPDTSDQNPGEGGDF